MSGIKNICDTVKNIHFESPSRVTKALAISILVGSVALALLGTVTLLGYHTVFLKSLSVVPYALGPFSLVAGVVFALFGAHFFVSGRPQSKVSSERNSPLNSEEKKGERGKKSVGSQSGSSGSSTATSNSASKKQTSVRETSPVKKVEETKPLEKKVEWFQKLPENVTEDVLDWVLEGEGVVEEISGKPSGIYVEEAKQFDGMLRSIIEKSQSFQEVEPNNCLTSKYKNIFPYAHNSPITHDPSWYGKKSACSLFGLSNLYPDDSHFPNGFARRILYNWKQYANISFFSSDRLVSQGIPAKNEDDPRETYKSQACMHELWMTVWEANISTIVMCTECVEKCRIKCAQYWPDDGGDKLVLTLGSGEKFEIEWMSSSHEDKLTKRQFVLRFRGETKQVTQYHLREWNDMEGYAPDKLLHLARKLQDEKLLIHCSAGVGRSGVFLATDVLVQLHQKAQRENKAFKVDLPALIVRLRQGRKNLIQDASQLQTLYKVVEELNGSKKAV